MINSQHINTYSQQGAALLLLMLVLFVAASGFFLGVSNSFSLVLQQQNAVVSELEEVKEKLIAYAGYYPDYYASGPGRLPCPDTDNDGAPEAVCTAVVTEFQGRLPQTLTLPGADASPFAFSEFNAGINRQFWYAVSPSFYPSAAALNTTTAGTFTVDGVGDYVAVIVDPGEVVSGQNRAGSNDANDYLEGGNEAGTNYVSIFALDPDNFTDRVAGITRSELMSPVTARVVLEIREQIDNYHQINSISRPPGSAVPFASIQTYPAETETSPAPQVIISEQDAFFTLAMAGAAPWYVADGWDTVTNYTYVSADEVQISFTNCNMVYTINFNTGVSRDVPTC